VAAACAARGLEVATLDQQQAGSADNANASGSGGSDRS
jgi:hypothetical protein